MSENRLLAPLGSDPDGEMRAGPSAVVARWLALLVTSLVSTAST